MTVVAIYSSIIASVAKSLMFGGIDLKLGNLWQA